MKRASLRAIAAALLSMLAALAPAAADSPFAPPPQAAPAFIRLLAFADYFDPRALEEFERQTGWRIAYDAYDAPESIPARLRQGAYDLVVLPGPVLSRQIAAGTLRKLDRARLPHAADVAPAIAAKLAAYDPGGQIAEPYMWFASGLLYDADRAPRRLGAPPTSWSAIFAPEQTRRLADCGLATLDSRDDLFMAAWRYLGANPARLTFVEIRRAADLLIRLKAAAPSFAIADVAGALANGSACLAFGRGPDAARAAARAAQQGRKLDLRFVAPREGAPMSLDALAIPTGAPHPPQAYALLDYLLRPDIAARNARATGLSSGEDSGDEETLKRLFPTGAVNSALDSFVEKEWLRVLAAR